MSEAWVDNEGKKSVPNEEADNGVFGDVAFFPSDFGMSDVGNNGSYCSGNKHGEPNEVVVINNKISKNRIETVIKNGDCDTNYEIAGGMLAGFNVINSRRLVGVFIFFTPFFNFFWMFA